MESTRQKMIQMNRREYGRTYPMFRWLDEAGAIQAEKERDKILNALPRTVQSGFCGTKLYSGELSPGCLLCGEGEWSCLFINGTCNGQCFYCPTEQHSEAEPTTNGVAFSNPTDYVAYLERFNIHGVGLSGGEPFLTFDRTLSFVTTIKKRFGQGVYVWMYTNGVLAREESLKKLKDAGLDEIRFDLSANGYNLDKVRVATGILGRVTVEIPAIPEDFELLKKAIPMLKDLGVSHLNLHHLRSTPFNSKNLIERDYTFLHGKQVTVLESELVALQLIGYEREHQIGLPVHYCSYVFKNQYQAMGHRKRIAPLLSEPYEDVTPVGVIRRMAIMGDGERLTQTAEVLGRKTEDPKAWRLEEQGQMLFFNASLLPYVDFENRSLLLDYEVPILRAENGSKKHSKEISLNGRKRLIVERSPVLRKKELEGDTIRKFVELQAQESESGHTGDGKSMMACESLEDLYELEMIRPGLQEYY